MTEHEQHPQQAAQVEPQPRVQPELYLEQPAAEPPLAQEVPDLAEQTTTPEILGTVPSIWVGSLLDCNNGRLHGDWLDARVGVDALRESITDILARSPTARETGDVAEEWGIFDHEGFGHYQVDEYHDLDRIAAVAQGIAEHGPAFAAWADLMGHDAELTAAQFEEDFIGHYPSLQAWGEQVMDDLGMPARIEELLPGDIARYVQIDGGAWARDALLSGDIAVVQDPEGGCWLFRWG